MDEHPLLAVGDEPEAHVRGVQQLHHAGGGRRLPAQALDRLFEVLSGRVDLDEEPGLVGVVRVHDGEVGAEGLAVLGYAGFEGWR